MDFNPDYSDAAYIDIYQKAKKSIYVVDDYVNTKTLQLLSQKQAGVEVVLFTEQAYHCGASSKDAGKKLCAINVIIETSMIHPVIDKLLLAPDKQI